MRELRHRALAGAAALCVALAACRADEAAEPSAPQAAPAIADDAGARSAYTLRGLVHPSLPQFDFTVTGEAREGADELHARSITIRSASASEPLQRIEGLDTQTPIVDGKPALEVRDMNFDGYADLRIVQSRSAGPNTEYRNWLFDPQRGRFSASPELDAIASPRFDAARGEIRSEWRDGATHYGTDVYVYRAGRPVPVRREERIYKAPGVYVLRSSERADGAWRTLEERAVDERKER